MKLINYLNEEKQKESNDIQKKIKDFFRKNPDPPDKKVHEYAESIGIDEHDFEEHIYALLSTYVKKDSVSEQKLNEIFVEEAHDDTEILRLSMIAELDAVNLYERMSKTATNADVKKILLDIAHEEKVHAGEFEMLLEKIDPAYEKAGEEGEKEVEKLTKGEEK